MSEYLYIFVDESGDYSDGEHYAVAACWCLSRHEPRHVLENARGDLAEFISNVCGFSSSPAELKGTKLPQERLGYILRTFEDYIHDDGTVIDPPYPWEQSSRPIMCSRHDFDPELGREIIGRYTGPVDAPKALQTLALAKLLNPLVHEQPLDHTQIDGIRLIPDAEVWETPATHVQQGLEEVDEIEIAVETRDSAATPGIQIADLMAYSWRKYVLDGECSDAADYLSEIGF